MAAAAAATTSPELRLFTDGSVNTQAKIGYGAYLVVPDPELPLEELSGQIKVKRFEQTSSTQLELETLLWALKDIPPTARKVIVYSDSQNIIGLPARRVRLEENDYRSAKNRQLNNYQLYQEFYRLHDRLNFELLKIRGHLPGKRKDALDRLFTLVDRAARNALREEIRNNALQPIKDDRWL